MPTLPSMNVMVIAATVILSLLILLWTWARWSMGQGARVLLRGLGAILLIVGLYLSGLGGLIGNGVRSIYDWAQRTTMSTPMLVGFTLAGVGLLFWLIGSFLRVRSREEAKAARLKRSGGSAAMAPAKPAKSRKSAPVAEDEDEVNAILERRGIQ